MAAVDSPIQRAKLVACGVILMLVASGLVACSDTADQVVRSPEAIPTRTLIPPSATPMPLPAQGTATPTDLPGAAALVPAGDDGGTESFTPQAVVARALHELITGEALASDVVRLVSLDAFEWTGVQLGCEQPLDAGAVANAGASGPVGESEPDSAATPGFRVVFNADNRVFVFHASDYGAMLRCADQDWLDAQGAPVVVDPIAESLVALSRRDAARQLDLAPDDALELVSLVTLTWPDASIGCPKPGADYDDRETSGYRIVLAAGDQHVIYHTSIQAVVRCPEDEEILPQMLRRALPAAPDESAPE